MAHMIESTDTLAYAGELPWHGIGREVRPDATTEEMIKESGLNWMADLQPLFTTVNGKQVAIDSHKAVVRDRDNRILGVVGSMYRPLQNFEAFKFFDPFIESGLAQYEVAGSLRDGKRVWVLAKVKGKPMEIVKNDVVNKYILLSNGHDGTLSVRAGFTGVRVVCNNTMHMAHTSAESKLIRLRHNVNVVKSLDTIREIMNLANESFDATAEQYKFLAKHTVSVKELQKYINVVLSLKLETEKEFKDSKALATVVNLFDHPRGGYIKGVSGTWWGAYNAVTEFFTHENGKNADNRMSSVWFGRNAKRSAEALDTALKMAA